MIQFLLPLRRLARSMVGSWRRDPRFRSLAFLVAFMLLSGTSFYRTVEGWCVVDAFYFSVTTLATVGLGDPAPSTTFGRLSTTVYIFAGVGVIAGFLGTLAREPVGLEGRRRDGSEDDEAPTGGWVLRISWGPRGVRRTSSARSS
jgi:ion channel